MPTPHAVEVRGTAIDVLAVMPTEEDEDNLKHLLPRRDWTLCTARTVSSAAAQLRRKRIAVVVCERDLAPGTWKEMLQCLDQMSDPPLLIVASRLADEQLWAEALNLGAYDVLAEPFDAREVNRTLSSAWLRWRGRHESLAAAERKSCGRDETVALDKEQARAGAA